MRRMNLLVSLLCVSVSLFSQQTDSSRTANHGLSFSARHRSISITYGVTTIFGKAPYNTGSTSHNTEGSFAVGPITVSLNKGLNKNLSVTLAAVAMYHRDRYRYPELPNGDGASNLLLGGGTVGFDYHFVNTGNIDPFVGGAGGVGYFWGRGGADQLGLRYKGKTAVLYTARAGMHIYNKSNNAWTIEAGYDYLSYVKIGYTLVKRR